MGEDKIRARLDHCVRGVPVVGRGPCADALYALLDLCDTNEGHAWTLTVRSSLAYHLGVTDA